MRGLKTIRTASVVIRGHAFMQNLRRNHYELGADECFAELVPLTLSPSNCGVVTRFGNCYACGFAVGVELYLAIIVS